MLTLRHLLSHQLQTKHVCGILHVPSERYSTYAPHFVEPVFRKEEQEQLMEMGEFQKFTHYPVKAARNDETCSVYHDEMLRKFTNHIMKKGNKELARDLLDRTFETIKRIQLEKFHKAKPEEKENIEINPHLIFEKAVTNCKPILQLTAIKRGGVTYQVPIPVADRRSTYLSMKWLIEAGQDKDMKIHFPDQLAKELIDAAKKQGRVVKRKQDLHKQCEANRAYAHYRWS